MLYIMGLVHMIIKLGLELIGKQLLILIHEN